MDGPWMRSIRYISRNHQLSQSLFSKQPSIHKFLKGKDVGGACKDARKPAIRIPSCWGEPRGRPRGISRNFSLYRHNTSTGFIHCKTGMKSTSGLPRSNQGSLYTWRIRLAQAVYIRRQWGPWVST
jgi:hypothetical protein